MRSAHLAPVFIVLVSLVWPLAFTHARAAGRYANSALKPWFDSLRSGKGPCCSDADGYAISDADWESSSGRYASAFRAPTTMPTRMIWSGSTSPRTP